MKKLISVVVLLGIALFCSVLFVGCDNLEAVALKNGIIQSEYEVGDSFDPTGAIIIEKTDKGIVETSLVNCTYSLKDFSTAEPVTGAVAKIVYKDHTIEFRYNVHPRSLGQIDVSVANAVYDENASVGNNLYFSYIYDFRTHVINIACETPDVNIALNYTNGTPFTGATNVVDGGYHVTATISKAGYQTETRFIHIDAQKLSITKVDYFIQDTATEALSNANANSVQYNGHAFKVVAKAVNPLADQTNPLADDYYLFELLTHGDTGAQTEANGLSKPTNDITSSTLDGSKCNPNNFKLVASTAYSWSIEKADLLVRRDENTKTLLNATDVLFVDSAVFYDGMEKDIVAQTDICEVVLEPGSPAKKLTQYDVESISYDYLDNGNSLGHRPIEVGTYTVRLTYVFKNYNDIVLEAELTIANP